MQFIPSYYELESYSNSINFIDGVSSSSKLTNVANSTLSSMSIADETAKSIAACKNHSEAERRRRKRINGHLATLRTLLPKTIKTDKASLLAEVVQRVRELKKAMAELTEPTEENGEETSNEYYMLPSESDELKVCYHDGDIGTVKVNMCCEERAELVGELRRAVKSVEGRVVRAEMATVGGRTRSVLWVKLLVGGDEGLVALRRALKVVVEKGELSGGLGSKRQRLYHY